jgi:hypothetical protein
MSFGKPEEAFEVEIVLGRFRHLLPDEESGMEAVHGLGQVLSDAIVVLFPGLLKGEERGFASVNGASGRIEGVGQLADFVNMDAEMGAGILAGFQTAIETPSQPRQRPFYRAPFFSARFR